MKLDPFRVRAVLRLCAAPALVSLVLFLPASSVAAATLGWIGYTYNFPSPGSVDPTTDLFINTETAPHGAAVSALVSYSTNGGTTWQSVALSPNGIDSSNSNDPNGSQVTVTDQTAVQSNKFYRVHISLP
jgi:hypothetical protein